MPDNNEKANDFVAADYLPYQTAGDLLAIKDDMLKAIERIVVEHPNLQQDYAACKAYSKYSVNGDFMFGAFSPSIIRYLVDNQKKPKMTDTVPVFTERMECLNYVECVYDAAGNPLMLIEHQINSFWRNDLVISTLYIVNYDDYVYFFTLPLPHSQTQRNYVGRAKYIDNRISLFEESTRSFCSAAEQYYAEKYFTFDGVNCCVTELLFDPISKYGSTLDDVTNFFDTEYMRMLNIPDTNPNRELMLDRAAEYKEKELKKCVDFYNNLSLPVLDANSSIRCVFFYELAFSKSGKLKQLEEVDLLRAKYRMVYPKPPKKPKTPSGLPRTKECLRTFKQRLKDNGYTAKKGITFAKFWNVFKEFAVNDKFDCAANGDSILWEPSTMGGSSIHIARQFIHENADGEYEFMEQLNIDFDIPFTQSTEDPFARVFWSDDNLEEFFAKVEHTMEFLSSDPVTVIEISMFFGEV